MKPLAIDLACGLGGWTQGLLAEGWDVVGFDIERHDYRTGGYPAQLVLQDILTLSGYQFRGHVTLIFASPPCQFFSYCAMPWTRGKKLAAEVRADPIRLAQELALFNACVRIGKEAECPTVIENVRGAQPWVGPAKANYGSFYLWGDIGMANGNIICGNRKELLPVPRKRSAMKYGIAHRSNGATNFHGEVRGDVSADMGTDALQMRGSWFNVAHNTESGTGNNPVYDATKTIGHVNKRDGYDHTRHLTNQRESNAVKNGNDWFGSGENCSLQRRQSSKSDSRKAASAQIAKIPFRLASFIARCFR